MQETHCREVQVKMKNIRVSALEVFISLEWDDLPPVPNSNAIPPKCWHILVRRVKKDDSVTIESWRFFPTFVLSTLDAALSSASYDGLVIERLH